MMARVYSKAVITGCVFGVVAAIAGCGGGDTDGGAAGDQNFQGDVYVPDGLGTLSVDVIDEELEVGNTTGFRVTLKNSSGLPITETRISCDSEDGVAILEPTTGNEFTDSNGQISGTIGCEARGSYLFGCRMPTGGNKRDFVTIRCGGEVPAGFNGFPGSAGGTLGGGSGGSASSPGVDEPGEGNVFVSTISFRDSEQENTLDIDTSINLCADGTTVETFTDASIKISVRNNSQEDVRFTSYRFSVPNVSGSTFTSSNVAFINSNTIVPKGGTSELVALFAQARSASGNDKFFPGSSTAIPDLGIRNVKVTVFGVDGSGNTFSITGTVAVSFGAYTNC